MAESQRKRRPADELERPGSDKADGDAERTSRGPVATIQALQRQAGNAAISSMLAGPKAGGPQASSDTFEAQLFDRSLVDPLRSLYAVVRDPAPNAELALQKLMPIGEALFDYYERYRGRDDGLSNAFLAARGWLVPAVDALRRRVGPVRPWSDEQIADRIQDTITEMLAIRDRLG